MPPAEIGLVARARGLTVHLLSRQTLESLAEAPDLPVLIQTLAHRGPAVAPAEGRDDIAAFERAIGRTAGELVRTLERWPERTPGLLDVFFARQDRRSLRALLRGSAAGAPSSARLEGLLPTPSLPRRALTALAERASPADVVRDLALLGHPDARRLYPLVRQSQVDLLAIDAALLGGFAERAGRAAARADRAVRDHVSDSIDAGNVQTALLFALGPRDARPADLFVPGGRWLSVDAFASAVHAGSQERALQSLAGTLARSPIRRWLPAAASDLAHVDRAFLSASLERLTRVTRLAPLSGTTVLRTLLLIEAQSHDLRVLAWGTVLGSPPSARRQQLVTP